MKYNFYGNENAVLSDGKLFPLIHTATELYDALCHCWCIETCSPGLREDWSEKNITLGQCSITALLAQDNFGGEIYGMYLPGGAVHCYNVVGDVTFDLTSEQFGDKASGLHYSGNVKTDRAQQLADAGKKQRYELLRERLVAYLAGRHHKL